MAYPKKVSPAGNNRVSNMADIDIVRSERVMRQSREFFAPPPCHVSVQLRSNSGQVPLTDIPYHLRVSELRSEEGTTDSEGCLVVENVPPGDYVLELPDKEFELLVSAIPTTVDRTVVRVAGYMLDERDDGRGDV